VTSGQQSQALGIKVALTMAIYEQPLAFCSWLAWCCKKFFEVKSAEDSAIPDKFIRLNVFSDIVWEVQFPGLFEICKPGPNISGRYPLTRKGGRTRGDANFYDYTAISPLGRLLPDNYDLTMSFKGDNWKECEDAMDAGYRSAAVFVSIDPSKGNDPRTRLRDLPTRLGRFKVIDGDSDDMRGRDPGGVVTGLRYKPPKMVPGIYKDWQRYRSGFIVPVVEMPTEDGITYMAVSVPRHTGSDFFVDDDDIRASEIASEQFESAVRDEVRSSRGSTPAEKVKFKLYGEFDGDAKIVRDRLERAASGDVDVDFDELDDDDTEGDNP
jgi:hypothetical protein